MTWTNRAKNIIRKFKGFFLSEVGDRYLVGENEDQFLITQEGSSGFTNRVKN